MESKPVKKNRSKKSSAKKKNSEAIDSSKEKSLIDIKESLKIAENCQDLSSLKKAVEEFEGCDLKKTALNTVFGDGNFNSNILVIGEAPGAKEDEKSIPFCGDSGILLSQMLEQIGLKRQDNYYVTNMVYWRPPANRKPTSEELAICRPFIDKLIHLMSPKLILLVGATSVSGILGLKEPITKLRNQAHQFDNEYISKTIPCFALFHPSYLLRQAIQKKNMWNDLLKLKKYIDHNSII